MNGDEIVREHIILLNDCRTAPDLALPPLVRGTPVDMQMSNFLDKLKQCSYIYTFKDEFDELGDNLTGKEVKRECLMEILEYISSTQYLMSHKSYKAIVNMVAANLFAFLPNDRVAYDPELDEPRLDRNWSHLSLVYDIFIEFMESPDFQVVVGRQYITEEFTGQLFDRFYSEDPRVREATKNTMHRIYSLIYDRRKQIKVRMTNILLKYIYESESFGGINELMEIVASIVNGYVVPIKQENIVFLMKIIIPLHSCKTIIFFHEHVVECLAMLIRKEKETTQIIVLGLLKYWPKNHENKAMLYLAEMEGILDGIGQEQFELVMVPLFKRFTKILLGDHFFNCEKVLYIFDNESIMNKIENNHKVLIPIILPALYTASKVSSLLVSGTYK